MSPLARGVGADTDVDIPYQKMMADNADLDCAEDHKAAYWAIHIGIKWGREREVGKTGLAHWSRT